MASQYADVNDLQFAGLLQVATAAADAQQRSAQTLGKRRRDDESVIDHQLRQTFAQPYPQSTPHPAPVTPATPAAPVLQNAAAVIFREPSEKSKKYSRPPLGKVFNDMQLAPETFLKLQNAAKAFMLDVNHPERLDVVGQRKESGNNDVAKLKLWTCVEQFLEMDLNGERYFGYGASAEEASGSRRSNYWPQDKEKVIKLCMPLFRKMVTNERQRLYASTTRKQDSAKSDRSKPSLDERSGASMGNAKPEDTVDFEVEAKAVDASDTGWPESALAPPQSPAVALTIHINVVTSRSNGRVRAIPRISVPSTRVPDLEAVYAVIQEHFDLEPYRNRIAAGSGLFATTSLSALPQLHVLIPEGVVMIDDDDSWASMLARTLNFEWLDREVRVTMEV